MITRYSTTSIDKVEKLNRVTKGFKDFRRDTRIAIARYLVANTYKVDKVDNIIDKATYIVFYKVITSIL